MSMMSKNYLNKYIQVYDLLIDFHYLRRANRSDSQIVRLGIGKSQILVELSNSSGLVASVLKEKIKLEKSTVSRFLEDLISENLIVAKRSHADSRQKILQLTKAGHDYVKRLKESQNTIIQKCMSQLSEIEKGTLVYYMRTLADGLGAESIASEPEINPLTVELVRQSRMLGYTSDSNRDFQPISAQYTLLRLINSDKKLSKAELKKIIPYDNSTVARALLYLKRERLVVTKKDLRTNGKDYVEFTPKGRCRFESSRATIAKGFRKALSSLSDKEVDDFIKLLERIVKPHKEDGEIVVQQAISVKQLTEEENLKMARMLLIENLYRQNLHSQIQSTIFSANNSCFGLYVANEMRAAIEISQSKKKFSIENFGYAFDCPQEDLGVLMETAYKIVGCRSKDQLKSVNALVIPNSLLGYIQ